MLALHALAQRHVICHNREWYTPLCCACVVTALHTATQAGCLQHAAFVNVQLAACTMLVYETVLLMYHLSIYSRVLV